MRKIAKLREWVSIDAAAEYLTNSLGERVTKEDLFVLAHERKLILSVFFPEGIWASEVVRLEKNDPRITGDLAGKLSRPLYLSNRDGYWLLHEEMYRDGVFDFAMEGGESIFIKRWAWGDLSKTDDFAMDEITLRTQNGTLICPGTLRFGDKNFPEGLSNWYCMPDEILLCLRITELDRLAAMASGEETNDRSSKGLKEIPPNETLSARENTTYLNIIAVMLEMLQSHRDGRETQAGIIAEMVEGWSDKPGIRKSTLEQKFSLANKRLKS